jgi:hypothetical protein
MSNAELQGFIETHEALLARTDAYVEFLRSYLERSVEGSELARLMQCALAPVDIGSFHTISPSNDIALINRLLALTEGSGNVSAAANEYTSPLFRRLKITEKYGGRFGKLIVSALNLFDSFLWPGQKQWLYQRFQEQCSRQQNLLDAFRRDYLG